MTHGLKQLSKGVLRNSCSENFWKFSEEKIQNIRATLVKLGALALSPFLSPSLYLSLLNFTKIALRCRYFLGKISENCRDNFSVEHLWVTAFVGLEFMVSVERYGFGSKINRD